MDSNSRTTGTTPSLEDQSEMYRHGDEEGKRAGSPQTTTTRQQRPYRHGTPLEDIQEQLRMLTDQVLWQQEHERQWEARYREQENTIQTLKQQVSVLKKLSKEKEAWTAYSNNPLALEIQMEQMPSSFRQSKETHDGTKVPSDHLIQYNDFMGMMGASDRLKCKVFPSTLRENARSWFLSLPAGSIHNFEQLGCQFLARFKAFKKIPKEPSYLYQVKQKPYETLGDFIQRFNMATMQVKDLQDSWAVDAFAQGVQHRDLKYAINDRKPKTLSELLERALNYSNVDDMAEQRSQELEEATRIENRHQKSKANHKN